MAEKQQVLYNSIPVTQLSDDVFYNVSGLDGLKGISALPTELQDEWIRRKKESGSLKEDASFNDVDRVYRNNLYVSKFGLDSFKSKTKEERDADFENWAYKDSFKVKSFGQSNQDIITTTVDNAEIPTKDLQKLNDKYHTEDEIVKDVEDKIKLAEDYTNPEKQENESWWNYLGRMRYLSTGSTRSFEKELGVAEPITEILSRAISEKQEDNNKSGKKKEGLGLFTGIDAFFKVLNKTGGIGIGNFGATKIPLPEISPEPKYSSEQPEDTEELEQLNADIDNQTSKRITNTRRYKSLKKQNEKVVQDLIDIAEPSLTAKSSEESAETADYMVDLSVNGDEQQQSELKDSVNEVLGLSNYYTAFKDKKELSDYSYVSQIEDVAMFYSDAQKYGESVAQTRLDARLRKRVAQNQNFWQHLGNDTKNIFLTGDTSFIVSAVMGMQSIQYAGRDAINAIFGYDTQYLANFLTQDVEKNQSLDKYLYNPKYWQYVDQFNTFDPKIIADGLANNGVASTMDVFEVDGVNKWLSAQTLHEGLKMAKFAVGSAIIGKTAGILGPAVSNYAVTAANVLGISESYGLQTVDQTLQQANQTIESIINRQANEYADEQAKVNTDVIRKIAEDYITENTDLKKTDSQYTNAINQLMDYATDIYKSQASQDWIEEHSKDYDYLRDQAQRAAVAAYAVDFVAEGIRMANVVPAARKYLYSKGARQWAEAKRLEREGIKSFRAVGADKVAANVDRWKQARKTIISGFTSNYLDDVTVGLGKGAGVSMFNDYVARTTDPSVAVNAHQDFGPILSALFGSISGAEEALTDQQSFYDGFIGGIGTIISGAPSIKWISNLASGKSITVDEAGQKRNLFRLIDQFVQNPVLSAYSTAVESEFNNPIVQAVNERMANPNVQKILTDFGAIRAASTNWDTANTLKEKKDAEALNMFEVVKFLNKTRINSNYANIPQVQTFLEQLNNYASGEITDRDIDVFLTQDENKSLSSVENNREIAKQKLQENSQKILDNLKEYSEKYEELNNAFKDKNWDELQKEFVIETLLFDTVLTKDWEQRLGDIEQRLKDSKLVSSTADRRALYPTKELWQARVDVTKDSIIKQEELLKLARDKFRKTKSRQKRAALQLNIQAYQENISELNQRLSELQNDADLFNGTEDTEIELLTSDEILFLPPEDRLAFLVGYDLYSKEQQNEINVALTELRSKYSDEEIWEMLRDSAEINQNIQAARKSYDRYMRGMEILPDYIAYKQSLRGREGRKAYSLAVEMTLHNRLDAIQMDDVDADGNPLLISEANKAVRTIGISAAKQIEHYIEKRPESKQTLTPLIEKLRLEEALVNVAAQNEAITEEDTKLITEIAGLSITEDDLIIGLNDAIRKASENGNEHLVNVLSKTLQDAENLVRQAKATSNDISKKELKKQREEAAYISNGKNFGWDGYYVNQFVWDTKTNEIGTIQKFNASEEEGKGSTVEVYFLRSKQTKTIDSLADITNEKPKVNKVEASVEPTENTSSKIVVEPPVENPTTKVVAPSELTSDENGNWETPTEIVGGEEEKSAVKDAEESLIEKTKEDFTKTTDTITGNRYYEYDVEESTDTAEKGRKKQRKRTASTKYQKIFFDWLNQNNIHLQDIIDNELGNILIENPEIELHFMSINPSQGKELSSMPILVVEYTKDVAKWHNNDRGGVITANGKDWLLVGVAGPAANADIKSADYIGRRTKAFKDSYYKQNPNEKYFVSSDYTNVKEMTSGRIVNQTLSDTDATERSLKDLLNDSTRNLEKLQIEDLKFLIQIGDKTKTIGISNEKVYPPSDTQKFNGATFLLVKAANGNYIPVLLSSVRLNDLSEGNIVRNKIEEVFSRIPSTDTVQRKKAFQDLVQLIVNTKENGIHERGNNQIAVVRDGVETLYELGLNFDTTAFLNDVARLNPRVNITANILTNKTTLAQYINSDVITTDVGLLGTVNASYSIYDVDTEGKPKISVETTGNTQGKSDYKETAGVKIQVAGKEYRRKNNRYYDINGNEITRDGNSQTYSDIYYTDVIQSRQLAPTPLGDGRNLYILNGDLNNPSAVVQRANGTFLVLNTQKAIDAINYKAKMVQEALKTRAMEEPLKQQPPTQQTMVNEFKGKSLSELQSTDNLTTFKQLFLKGTVRNTDGTQISVRQRLSDIAKSKGWDWGSKMSERESFLQKKGIQIDNITDIETWCNNIESCK